MLQLPLRLSAIRDRLRLNPFARRMMVRQDGPRQGLGVDLGRVGSEKKGRQDDRIYMVKNICRWAFLMLARVFQFFLRHRQQRLAPATC
jgi:hypothetical protein